MYASGSKPATILIIDDNITNLKVAMNYLKAYSFNILTARDGIAGIERAQLTQPDLILLDVQLGQIDGFETCRRLKANPVTTHIPVIFMTVLSDTADKVRGLEAGAIDYVTKPIEETELLARVNTQLRLHALQSQLQQVNTELEAQVEERAAALEAEVARRTADQVEKEALFNAFRRQNEQFQQLSQMLLETQESSSVHAAPDLRTIALLETQLTHAHQLVADPRHQPVIMELAAEAIRSALDTVQLLRQQAVQIGAKLEQASLLQGRTNPLHKLSDREYEVFQLLVQGKSNAEIGESLFLAKTTVSTYQRRIMEKLGVSELAELTNFTQL